MEIVVGMMFGMVMKNLSFCLEKNMSIHEFNKPIPVVIEDGKEGYAIYVESGGTFENDIWCVVHCEGGHVRHYRSDQILIHASGTFDISKKRIP